MNVKKVKLLRKQLGYHPTDQRFFRQLKDQATIFLSKCSRVAYKAAKRAAINARA